MPNAVITKVNPANGRVGFYNFSGTVDVLADVFGYFDDGTETTVPGQLLRVLPKPERSVDTRSGKLPVGSQSTNKFTLTAGETRTFRFLGVAGVPASSTVSAAAINVTVDRPTADGFLSIYPFGVGPIEGQKTSSLNFLRGVTVPNFGIINVGSGGQISVYNGSAGTLELLIDVFGYFQAVVA